MPEEENERLERLLLLHLLEHRGQQIRFEASQWTTEFGITRKFSTEDPGLLRQALRTLEMSRMIYLRTQYVVGYSEPKHVYSLTPSGHRKALEYRREENGSDVDESEPSEPEASDDGSPESTGPSDTPLPRSSSSS
jgi:DNA-binding PadR family transcriptional regulator